MYTNTNLEVIQDNAPYTDSEGEQYPRNFPKDEIAELFPVTMVDCPECDVSEGWHIELIGDIYTQVWDTRDYTQEELDALVITQCADIQCCQSSLITDYGWRAVRYITQKDLWLEGMIASMSDTQDTYIQICAWLQAIRDVNNSGTYDEQKASMTALEGLFPYTNQTDYDADALGLRT